MEIIIFHLHRTFNRGGSDLCVYFFISGVMDWLDNAAQCTVRWNCWWPSDRIRRKEEHHPVYGLPIPFR